MLATPPLRVDCHVDYVHAQEYGKPYTHNTSEPTTWKFVASGEDGIAEKMAANPAVSRLPVMDVQSNWNELFRYMWLSVQTSL